MNAQEILKTSPIIPVIVIDDSKNAIPLAKALLKGGLKVLEITLRTQDALESIRIIREEVPEAIVGAGTVLNAKQFEEVQKVGAHFAISPGLNALFAKQIEHAEIPLIPGVATAGEVMLALEFGFKNLKFFPAEVSGGVNLLKSFVSPFREVKFCPTGGIHLDNIKTYLSLENVLCIGGSWVAPTELIKNQQWDKITEITQKSLSYLA